MSGQSTDLSDQMREKALYDPIHLAIAVLVERVRRLPVEDRNDLFELTKALMVAETDEERNAATSGMQEILEQSIGGLREIPPIEPGDELRKWMDFIGGRIKHFREAAGLTQVQLADKAGLPQSHISRLETGQHSPSSMTLEKIAEALGIPSSKLDPSV